jgi:putative endopeptidase
MKKSLLFFIGIALIMAYSGCKSKKSKNAQTTDVKGYDVSLMDKSVSPCQDFYRYAAGGWMDANPVPPTDSRWGMFNVLGKQNDERIKNILDELISNPNDLGKGTAEQLSRDFYLSALDTSTIENYGAKPLIPIFNFINGMKQHEDLGGTVGILKKYGLPGPFNFYVNIDSKNSGYYISYLSQGGLGLPDIDYYLKEDSVSLKIKAAYLKYMTNMFHKISIENGEKVAQRILQLETDLARNSMSRQEQRDPDKTYNKFSRKDLMFRYKAIDFAGFFDQMGAPVIDEIIVNQTDFFDKFQETILNYSVDEWKTYLKWQSVNRLAPYLSSSFEKAHFDFYNTTLKGTKEMKPRWEKAVSVVNSYVGESLGQLFVKKHFSPDSKEKVGHMVEELRTAFAQRIEALDWMSAETKLRAKEKLAAFTYKIGYPDKWKDYSDVEIKHNNLIQNILNMNAKRTAMMLEKTGKEVDVTEWGMTPQTVNAYYSPTRNEIVFPAGILQPPFFDPKADDALNYGGIGAVIGHEFSHGFDDKGSKYDGKGNLSNWWTEEDKIKFKERTQSIVNQFNEFEVLEGVFINGELTQGENIADLAGLTLAYYALKNTKDGKKETKSPDGFAWQQRFFLSWSLVWAQNITEKELRQRIITDPHSPGQYRVWGPLANLPEFHEAFGCKQGDNMVADEAKKVIIW